MIACRVTRINEFGHTTTTMALVHKWAIETQLRSGEWVHADWTSDDNANEWPCYYPTRREARAAFDDMMIDARALNDFDPRQWRIRKVPAHEEATRS